MQNIIWKKGIVIGIILLFIGQIFYQLSVEIIKQLTIMRTIFLKIKTI